MGANVAVSTSVGVGLVGAGRIAQMFHLPILRDHPRARLVAVCDAAEDGRRAAIELDGHLTVAADLAAVVNHPEVAAVIVCTPPLHHREAVEAALAAGRHLYVEKPLTVTVADAAAVRDRAAASPELIAAAGFNLRFHPAVRGAYGALRDGMLGDLVAVRGVMTSSPRNLPDWKRDATTGGGALLDLASHHVDLVRHLLDEEVVTVSAHRRSVRTADDTAVVQAVTASGVPVQLTVSTSSPQRDQFELVGTKAAAQVDRMVSPRVHLHRDVTPTTTVQRLRAAVDVTEAGLRDTADRLRPAPEPSFAAALSAFLAAVAGDGPWRGADLADGLASLRVVDAATRSADEGGRPVAVATDAAAR